MVSFEDVPPSWIPPELGAQNLAFTPPPMPPALKAAAEEKAASDPERADKAVAKAAEAAPPGPPPKPPAVAESGRKLSGAKEDFPVDDPKALEEALVESVESYDRDAHPYLKELIAEKPEPTQQLADIARAKKALTPEEFDAMLRGEMPPPPPAAAPLAVSAGEAQALAKLGKADALGEALGTEDPDEIAEKLREIAAVMPPQAAATPAEIVKMATMLDQIATVQEAYGPDALTREGLRAIAEDHRKLMALGPQQSAADPKTVAALAAMPKVEDVEKGAEAARKAAGTPDPAKAEALAAIRPPKIRSEALMEALGALRKTLDKAIASGPPA